ncbi:ice-binding family protein [Legionella sp. CNM-1927-20]|uniref:ice-binding family protein n=1 Tax=Legionella sp. CNM-1927-20 TaxID=3422221 RepID=UPI00403AD0DE
MLKKFSYGIALCSLILPLLGMAKSEGLVGCAKSEVSFIQIPNFAPFMTTFTAQSGVYIIRNNNTRMPINLQEISLIRSIGDTLPDSAALIDRSFPNTCQTSLAPGATCNIHVVLYPTVLGTYSRYLHIGISSRQCRLASPPFFVNVTPIVEPDVPGVVFTTPFFSCLLNSKAALTSSNTPTNSIVLGGVCSGAQVNGFTVPGTALAIHNNDAVANADLADTAALNTSLRALCPAFPLAGPITGTFISGSGPHCFTGATDLTGQVVISGPGNHFFIVEEGLNIAPGAQVILVNGATPANVFFSTSGQTTFGDGSFFQGILIGEQANLTIGSGVTVRGAVKNLGASFNIGQVTVSAP